MVFLSLRPSSGFFDKQCRNRRAPEMHTGRLIKDIFEVVKEAEKSAMGSPNQNPPEQNDEARQERDVSAAQPVGSRAQ
jgi:hypothetical protein